MGYVIEATKTDGCVITRGELEILHRIFGEKGLNVGDYGVWTKEIPLESVANHVEDYARHVLQERPFDVAGYQKIPVSDRKSKRGELEAMLFRENSVIDASDVHTLADLIMQIIDKDKAQVVALYNALVYAKMLLTDWMAGDQPEHFDDMMEQIDKALAGMKL